ncbi:hypothetical protein [Rufibacter sp. LB8]|uniref:hypothetical protein n=1 Tax=Rufibacter sp. LB8 TaxID=2777781 RepID=UPI00178C3D18|nr:hypothetical protein [Rufibacter sp. LB8]
MSKSSSLPIKALLLDPSGDAPAPEGYSVIDTDVAWLKAAAKVKTTDNVPKVVVRGVERCNWAYIWWQALGGQTATLISPSVQLRERCPSLTEQQARKVLSDLPIPFTTKLPPLWEILKNLYPSFSHWNGLLAQTDVTLVRNQASYWLSWLSTQSTQFPEQHLPVIKKVVADWHESFPDAAAFFPTNSAQAKAALTAWIGYENPMTSSPALKSAISWATQFPLPVTNWITAARNAFLQQLVTTLSGVTKDKQDEAALAWWQLQISKAHHPEIRQTALQALVQQLHSPIFSHAATELLISQLERSHVATPALVATLRQLVPPPVPPPVPSEPSGALQWVTQQYLPYRLWQASQKNNDKARAEVQRLSEAFSDWFLETYPIKLVGTPAPYQQQFWAARALKKPASNEIVLWVIADGLGWDDALTLQKLVLSQAAGRLSLIAATPCFGLVPTITSHTKRAVRWGVPLEYTQKAKEDYFNQLPMPPVDVRGIDNLAEAVHVAQAGQLLVWLPPEPDSIYHNPGNAQTIRNNAVASLTGIALSICEAVAAVPIHTEVRVIITTDHGRLLSESPRTLDPISGFTGHGRAAYRASPPHKKPIPRPDKAIDTDTVRWLDPDRFKLPDWVAIARSDASFKIVSHTGSMRGGTDIFPHGGAWPEEVVVPWIELQSNLEPLMIGGFLSGESRSYRQGKAELHLNNSSSRPARLRKVKVQIPRVDDLEIEFDELLPGTIGISKSIEIPRWPDTAQAEKTVAQVTLETPDGELHTFNLNTNLRNTDLRQSSTNPLDDLF